MILVSCALVMSLLDVEVGQGEMGSEGKRAGAPAMVRGPGVCPPHSRGRAGSTPDTGPGTLLKIVNRSL